MNTTLTKSGEYNDPKTGEKGTVKVSYDPLKGRLQVIIDKSIPCYIPPQEINRELERRVMKGLDGLNVALTESQAEQILSENKKK
jgi:hypothetical protein